MFKRDTNYWIIIRGNGVIGQMNVKCKVIEENSFMLKVVREATLDGKYPEKEMIIMLSEILRVNEAVHSTVVQED